MNTKHKWSVYSIEKVRTDFEFKKPVTKEQVLELFRNQKFDRVVHIESEELKESWIED